MNNWIIAKLGGFTTVDDFINKVNLLSNSDKHKILTETVKDLYNTINSDDILKEENDKWLYEGRELTAPEVKNLKEYAENFVNSQLFKVLDKDLRYQANRRMFIDSQSNDDLIAGKLLLYLWDVVKTRLKRI